MKMASPTPSLESIPRANSIGSFGDQHDYLSLSPLADSPLSISGSSPPVSDSVDRDSDPSELHCQQCREPISDPKLLSCFHTFCNNCLEKNKLICPRCNSESIEGILSSLLFNGDNSNEVNLAPVRCTGCKHKKLDAVARCVDCVNYLCSNCVMAHQFMHCFEGHRVVNLQEIKEETKNGLLSNSIMSNTEKSMICPRHKSELLKYYCRTCAVPICKECLNLDHPVGLHDYEHISEAAPKQIEAIQHAVTEAKSKATDIRNSLKNAEHVSSRLQVHYHKAQNEINDTFLFYRSMLEERKQELLKELESVFSAKQISLGVATQKGQETCEQIYKTCEFVERLNKCANVVEILMFRKLLDAKLQGLLNYNIDQTVQAAGELEFVSNYQAIQVGVRNTFGYVRSSAESLVGPSKQPPIARPTGGGGSSSSSGSSVNGSSVNLNGGMHCQYNVSTSSQSTSPFESNIISKRFSSANSLGPFSTTIGDLNLNGINPYEKWSNGGADSIFQSGTTDPYSLSSSAHNDSMLDLTTKLMSTAIFPPKSQIKRQKMIYHCKFGEFGVMEGQFTEPSGVAVNAQNDIIVADTNNHRIQIFDKEGRFKFQFGECGKRDGQLLYPNRVAVVRTSGDIIVTERSPTHQIQIYNQYGQFVRKFGANILQHPRGVTVDNKGRIVVVECKVMRVIIFDQTGSVLQKFGCSKHLEFPNGVVVNDKQEIFISDNRAHCVKVFSYEGVYLRQIGGEGITNYPIGVGINANGEILIADNHNNFNLTIFTQDGQLVSALESKVKHAQCFDVALMDDGSVVLASKDYRLYIYRYVQVPPIGL
ncbi:brain tumor protein [Diorhabda carinulata]|uniref:brain tumor protein n=1 Tax=Diorhabda carinulata TaxID=1163345 RepID=UPI0025A2A8DB|nr:brain tumor protein [Diorhabda carinulata]XP_057666493.1 brain tumor protein [Diorhabda carinulata]XP_057666494.1 brain tumor protein [Diorhabda carinulata]XP_057666495.1 brain tumor protein [Diorhabda carinulata]XP_057666496.1 brain tumor protein [Diorhabda carinulata]XP_057666497.1 brain tumor protein [Diorhabda carinulata]XP_057666498.1 brain tumor protein [Diorhabda carinulata]XP_057666499.1 brain tumor protein [Diorhabda carinulata]